MSRLRTLAELAEPRARPFLIGRSALGDRDQRPAGEPILQRRQLDLADLGAEVAEDRDCRSDAALRALADLVVGLMEMVNDTDPQPSDAAAELGRVIRDRAPRHSPDRWGRGRPGPVTSARNPRRSTPLGRYGRG